MDVKRCKKYNSVCCMLKLGVRKEMPNYHPDSTNTDMIIKVNNILQGIASLIHTKEKVLKKPLISSRFQQHDNEGTGWYQLYSLKERGEKRPLYKAGFLPAKER